eukprot:gene1161-1268_t
MSLSQSYSVFRLAWNEVATLASVIIPPLTYLEHKGSMGRIAVLGGSRDYTGAPYYAAKAALKFGGDLSFVFCSEQAATPIKCYSPELMVTPVYQDSVFSDYSTLPYSKIEEEITRGVSLIESFLPRIHALVVGPGMGRNPHSATLAARLLGLAKQRNLATVIDADGLWLVSQQPALVHGYLNCILTPNAAEFERLVEAVLRAEETSQEMRAALGERDNNNNNNNNLAGRARALSQALGGVTILCKGAHDILTDGHDVYELLETGSPRRCGGQGDLLAGSLAVALHWSNRTEKAIPWEGERPPSKNIVAGLLAATVVKKASAAVFAQQGRSMTTPDVLAGLGQAFSSFAKE